MRSTRESNVHIHGHQRDCCRFESRGAKPSCQKVLKQERRQGREIDTFTSSGIAALVFLVPTDLLGTVLLRSLRSLREAFSSSRQGRRGRGGAWARTSSSRASRRRGRSRWSVRHRRRCACRRRRTAPWGSCTSPRASPRAQPWRRWGGRVDDIQNHLLPSGADGS